MDKGKTPRTKDEYEEMVRAAELKTKSLKGKELIQKLSLAAAKTDEIQSLKDIAAVMSEIKKTQGLNQADTIKIKDILEKRINQIAVSQAIKIVDDLKKKGEFHQHKKPTVTGYVDTYIKMNPALESIRKQITDVVMRRLDNLTNQD